MASALTAQDETRSKGICGGCGKETTRETYMASCCECGTHLHSHLTCEGVTCISDKHYCPKCLPDDVAGEGAEQQAEATGKTATTDSGDMAPAASGVATEGFVQFPDVEQQTKNVCAYFSLGNVLQYLTSDDDEVWDPDLLPERGDWNIDLSSDDMQTLALDVAERCNMQDRIFILDQLLCLTSPHSHEMPEVSAAIKTFHSGQSIGLLINEMSAEMASKNDIWQNQGTLGHWVGMVISHDKESNAGVTVRVLDSKKSPERKNRLSEAAEVFVAHIASLASSSAASTSSSEKKDEDAKQEETPQVYYYLPTTTYYYLLLLLLLLLL